MSCCSVIGKSKLWVLHGITRDCCEQGLPCRTTSSGGQTACNVEGMLPEYREKDLPDCLHLACHPCLTALRGACLAVLSKVDAQLATPA